MEASIFSQNEISTTKENIKFPFFNNPDIDNLISDSQMDTPSLQNNIQLLLSSQSSFESTYESLITSDTNTINNSFYVFNKYTLKYYYINKSLNKLVKLINSKIFSLSIEDTVPLDKIVDEYLSIPSLAELIQHQIGTEKNLISQWVELIESHIQSIKESDHSCGISAMNFTIILINYYYGQILAKINVFQAIKKFHVDDKSLFRKNELVLFDLILLLEKMEIFDIILTNTFFVDENDIFNKPESSPEWQQIKSHYTRFISLDNNKIKEGFAEYDKNMVLGRALVFKNFKSDSDFKNLLSCGSSYMEYFFNYENAIYDSKKAEIIGNQKKMIHLMTNLGNINYLRNLKTIGYDSIATRKKVYTKREYIPITVEYISSILEKLNQGKLPDPVNIKINTDQNENTLFPKTLLTEIDNLDHALVEGQYVSNRLIYNKNMIFPGEKMPTFTFNKPMVGCDKNAIFIYIHGGGFVGGTFSNPEDYLRKWVNHLGIPLIGVNYALSPKNKYPKAIDDCWQTYNWILEHSEKELGIKPEKIIISGDSAGGTITLALVNLLICHHIRIPDLILANYPCSNTSYFNEAPSMLISLQEPVINFLALQYYNEAYRDNVNEENDPFLNPVMAGDIILKKYKRIVFFLGSTDPLRDDNIRLIYKMSKFENINLKCYEFHSYPHMYFGGFGKFFVIYPTKLYLDEIDKFLNENKLIINKDL